MKSDVHALNLVPITKEEKDLRKISAILARLVELIFSNRDEPIFLLSE
jgi:hypothetical protein